MAISLRPDGCRDPAPPTRRACDLERIAMPLRHLVDGGGEGGILTARERGVLEPDGAGPRWSP